MRQPYGLSRDLVEMAPHMTAPDPTARAETQRIGGHEFGGAESHNCIELRLPSRPAMWGLLRMAVSTVASSLEANVDRIEDLRIAVAELCTLCATGSGPETVLDFVIRFDSEMIAVSCTASDLSPEDGVTIGDYPDGFAPGEISRKILEALVDDFEVLDVDRTTRQGWFVARAHP